MKHGFCKTKVALGVALFLGSGVVWAADAISNTAVPTPGIADGLNSSGTSSPTKIGNGGDVTINGATSVSGAISSTGAISSNSNISAATGTVSGKGVSAGANGLSSNGGAKITGNTDVTGDLKVTGNSTLGDTASTNIINGDSTTINSTTNKIGTTSSDNTISGAKTTIDSATNQIGAASSSNTISGTATTINSATNTIGVANTSTNIIQGNTATINGATSVTATSENSNLTLRKDSAQATVDSGKSVVGSKQTTSQMSIGNIGEQGVRVDTNGKMTPTNTLDQSTAALTVTNGQGNTHGFVVNEKSATMSGGTTSTSMTLNNGGARFSNASTGGPARVTGIADGRHDYDAVNYRQLKSVKSGIAGIAAMTNVPHVEQNKKFALGIGVGHYDGTTSMAVGASARLSENAVIKASVSNGVSGGSTRKSTVYGIGAGFSW